MQYSLLLFQPPMIAHFNTTVSTFRGWFPQIGMKKCLVIQEHPSHDQAVEQTKGQ